MLLWNLAKTLETGFLTPFAEGDVGVWQLSLRPSQGAWREGVPAASTADGAAPETLALGDLKIGQQVGLSGLSTPPVVLL